MTVATPTPTSDASCEKPDNICGHILCHRPDAPEEHHWLRGTFRGWTNHLEEPPPVHGRRFAKGYRVRRYIRGSSRYNGTKNLLLELGIGPGRPKIYEDNDGARRHAMSGMGQKRARHLEIKHHLVQDLCQDGQVEVVRLPGVDQPADLLTKGSHTEKTHAYLREGLGVVVNA